MDCSFFGVKWVKCIRTTFSTKSPHIEKHEKCFFSSYFQIIFSINVRKLQISCCICGLDIDMSKISSIKSSTDPWRIESAEKMAMCSVKIFGAPAKQNKTCNEFKKFITR